jgi:hypothetical protein
MVVALNTFDSEDAGTDDEIYLGLWGTGGGREFPLSSSNHDDFERGASDLYMIGVDPGFGFRQSDRSKPGEANDPALVPIELGSIQYVYLRKQAYGTEGDDNAWRLSRVIVLLYDAATFPLPRNRIFFLDAPKGMWFGNEHGHQAWLSESRVSEPGVRALVDKVGAKAFQAVK